ncbi:MAG TPA: 16S rRNA (guanine(527)-N(7))-methyltransferase RsmG [Mycobacteriales bacterium]|nr:16S rRNA (guanine(527)-N(7))-methyltransferase RsmG [Mycobacteriales bacterium]
MLDAAAAVFGDRWAVAQQYERRLATDGIEHGLIGPREGDRLWSRHILNSAAIAELIPPGAAVVDVGSGAGLPGIPVALARPDLRVALLEAQERRVAFLQSCVAELGLGVDVVRGRAEDRSVRDQVGGADVVTARALAPLDRLVRWCLPLVRRGGVILAVKGARAAEEVRQYRPILIRSGAADVSVRQCGTGSVLSATVVEIVRT